MTSVPPQLRTVRRPRSGGTTRSHAAVAGSAGRWLPYATMVVGALLGWQLLSAVLPPDSFPGPLSVAKEIVGDPLNDGYLLINSLISLRRIAIGFVIGSALGAIAGFAMGFSDRIGRPILEPYVSFFRFIPATGMIALATTWFGEGDASKIFIVVFGTFFYVALNTQAGVHAVVVDRIRGAQALGARPGQILRSVTLPSCVPFVVTGMRMGMTNAVSTVVAAEMVVAYSGLGYVITQSNLFLKNSTMLAAVVLLGVLGFCLDRTFRLIIRRFGGAYTNDR